jgi:hypothetical protein
MKGILKLLILVAALLLVTNIAFAAPICDEHVCYNVSVTYQDGTSHGEFWSVCLNDDGTGSLGGLISMYLFGRGPFGFSFDAHPGWTKWVIHNAAPLLIGDIWTDQFGFFLTGEGYAGATVNSRWTVNGMKSPCP